MSKHFVKTLRLDLTANSEKEGFQMQQGFSELIRSKLNQKMTDIFDEFGSDQNIKIENLELEVQGVEADNWEEDFIEKFSTQLIAKLKEWRSNSASSPSSTVPTKKSEWKSFLFFLKNGFFPWSINHLNINNLDTFIKKEIESLKSVQELEIQIKSDSHSLRRMINQLQPSTLDFIFNKISKADISFYSTYKILEKTYSKWWNKNEVKLEIWKIAFHFSLNNSSGKIGKNSFQNKFQLEIITKSISYFSKKKLKSNGNQKLEDSIFKELKSNFQNSKVELSPSVKSFFQQKKIEEKSFTKKNIPAKENTKQPNFDIENDNLEEIIKEGIFIKNAGLILLAPFLQYLFKDFEMLEDKNFKNETDQNQAALILQYLVTEEFFTLENELALNKILCNIPLQEPIATELFLEQNQIDECAKLLNAIIKNWPALGNTSIQGLRESFLNRNGKLTKKENGDWLLQVESKSFDVLLSSLPWAISVIKLPWMDQKMMVDWQ